MDYVNGLRQFKPVCRTRKAANFMPKTRQKPFTIAVFCQRSANAPDGIIGLTISVRKVLLYNIFCSPMKAFGALSPEVGSVIAEAWLEQA